MRPMILALLCGCTLQGPFLGDDTAMSDAAWDDPDQDGYVGEDDCGPADFDVNPGAPERCDGQDNDCDGVTDEDDAIDAPMWYRDADGDGHGGDELGTACQAPESSATSDSDCNDRQETVYYGAEEICDDGLDNDCDGYMGCRWDEQYNAADVQLSDVQGSEYAGYLGKALLVTEDLSGDGEPDLVVTAPAVDSVEAGKDAGAFYVYEGPLTEGAYTPEQAYARWEGPRTWAYVGYSAVAMGDLGGDGLIALGLGSGYDGDISFFLDFRDVSSSGEANDPDLVLQDESYGTHFGVAALGEMDLDGDGALEVAIGAPLAELSRGQVWLYTQDSADILDNTGSVYGNELSERIGTSLASGDLNGDGRDELIVGAPGAARGGADAGGLYIVDGAVSGTESIGDTTFLYIAYDGCLAGSALAAPDSDGDGYADLLVGGPDCTVRDGKDGAAWLALGGATPFTSGTMETSFLVKGEDGEEVGFAVASGGDMDGDGSDEILVSAPGWSASGTSGALLLWYGPVEGEFATQEADAMFIADIVDERLGHALSAGHDLSGDGLPDFAGGSPGAGGTYGLARVIPGLSF